MEKDIPIVIAYFGGKPNYLQYTLKSAANYNKTVVLIGDDTNKGFWGNHWDTSTVIFDKFEEFKKYYVQMSGYPVKYEMAFWKRMFVLEKWMVENNYQRIFLFDSDVLIFADYSREVFPVLPQDCIASLMTSKNQDNFVWASSCHCSYWTLDALKDFTNFCIEAYRNKNIREKLEAKWQWHKDNHQPGGICEMTLLYLWARDNPKVSNFTQVFNGMTADYNINEAGNYADDEYPTEYGIKKFIFKEGIPHGYNKFSNTLVKFWCIHCQGGNKGVMRFLYDRRLRRCYCLTQFFYGIKLKLKTVVKKMIGYK
jgi:hypothetical protein